MKGREISNQTKKRLSDALKGNKNGQGNKGMKHSLQFRENLRNKKTKPDEEVSPHALYMREYRKRILEKLDTTP